MSVTFYQCWHKRHINALVGKKWSHHPCKANWPLSPREDGSVLYVMETDAEAEAPIFWPPDVKSQHIGKDPDAGKGWRQEEKGVTEDKMVGWHHQLNGYEFEQTLGDSEGQGTLACYSSWGHKESDMTEWLNNNKCTINCIMYFIQISSIFHLYPFWICCCL